jgi:Pyrimidine dimer DNA glycosylase
LRIWDVSPDELCRLHLLGEHRELHALWTILTLGKSGYRNHPETRRWVGKQACLFIRHEALAAEMTRRGYLHKSDLDPSLAVGNEQQTEFVDPVERQRALLAAKPCDCYRSAPAGQPAQSEHRQATGRKAYPEP